MKISIQSLCAKAALFVFLSVTTAQGVFAATWYVNSSATGSKNGTSWANGWTNLDQITGVSAGDTVYISGGSSGTSLQYTQLQYWAPASGTTGNPITYKIGQDAAHNGTAVFNVTNPTNWVGGSPHDVVISGDAGDGAMHFKMGSGVTYPVNGNGFYNFRFSYVDCGNPKYGMSFSGVHGIEIDHTYFKKANGGDDHWIVFFMTGNPTWDNSKIHDNTVLLPRDPSSGAGDDGIQGNPDGLSIYNNNISGYATAYSGGQHQDGIQFLKGTYIKVYGNTFTDIANYPIYGDAYTGDFTHFWVYNNIVRITDSTLQAGNSPQAIVIGEDGGAFSNLGRHPIFTDCMMSNNTVLDYGIHQGCVLNATPAATMINCVAKNNLTVNTGANSFHSSVLVSNNVSLSSTSASDSFVKYSALSLLNNTTLISSASALIDKGMSLGGYFATDISGNPRPQGANWDVGAYEYSTSSAGPTPPSNATITIATSP